MSMSEASGLELENLRLRQQLVAAEARIEVLLGELDLVKRNANHDTLTGLLRRGFFLEELDRYLSLMVSGSGRKTRKTHLQFASVIFLDIDNFKSINDTYGHTVGDMVLQSVAWVVKSSLRPKDPVCRWGGEEIIILLAGVSQRDVLRKAELIRRRISAIRIDKYPHVQVTASLGVATASAKLPVSAESLIARADGAMYRAKEGGRNRVVSAP